MFRIVFDPSSGSIKLYLAEIRSCSLMFVLCLVGVWQRNFEPVVCVYGTTGWELLVLSPSYRTHTQLVQNYAAKHRPSTRQTSVNHYEFQSNTSSILPDDRSHTIGNMSE